MKKIINGKRYDTETADLVAQDYADCQKNDFHFWWEGLYKKKTGEFFLHGEGGAMSKYATHNSSGGSGWGEVIIPLSLSEAKRWAENHMCGDKYEALFGAVEE